MMTVESITAAISELPPDQLARLRTWLDEWLDAAWDAQIEQDERDGKLDRLAERALAEHRGGEPALYESPHDSRLLARVSATSGERASVGG